MGKERRERFLMNRPRRRVLLAFATGRQDIPRHFGIGFMGGAVWEAWRSVLRRDKGGRLGRDAFRVGSPRRLSNGRKRASAHSMRPTKTRPLSPCSALHTSTRRQTPSRSTPSFRSLFRSVRPSAAFALLRLVLCHLSCYALRSQPTHTALLGRWATAHRARLTITGFARSPPPTLPMLMTRLLVTYPNRSECNE